MSKPRRKHSECPNFPLAAEVLHARELLSSGVAGAAQRHALRVTGHTSEHPAKSTPTFAGFSGQLNGIATRSVGGAPVNFAGTMTISPFHIKPNATVKISFSGNVGPTSQLTAKFKINGINQNGDTLGLVGKQSSGSGNFEGQKLGHSKSNVDLEITSGIPDSLEATFTLPTQTGTLHLSFS